MYNEVRYIKHIPKVELIKGDVVETIPKYVNENSQLLISLLYLDMDLYKPTKVAIENLVPRIPKGGIIVFDELCSKHFPGETTALLETMGIRDLKIEKFSFNNYMSYVVL